MFNKYLLIAIAVLFCGCVVFYNMWDNTKEELASVKRQNTLLEQELKRRDDNERNLSKRITELTELYATYADWANTRIPDSIVSRLSKSCKSCK